MIYAKVCDASALERLDAALCQATSLKCRAIQFSVPILVFIHRC